MDSSSPDQFSNEVQGQIGEARERLDAFLALSGAASGDEIVRTFDAIRRPLDVVVGRIGLLSSVHPDGKLRDRAERLEPRCCNVMEWARKQLQLRRASHISHQKQKV